MSAPEDPATVTVRLDSELVRKARIICAHAPGRGGKHLKLVDFLDQLVREPINQQYEELMRRLAGGKES